MLSEIVVRRMLKDFIDVSLKMSQVIAWHRETIDKQLP